MTKKPSLLFYPYFLRRVIIFVLLRVYFPAALGFPETLFSANKLEAIVFLDTFLHVHIGLVVITT